MSLINQMLNELEGRGANVPLGEDSIRAVPPRQQLSVLRYAILGGALLILLAAATWYLRHADTPAKEKSVVATMPVNVTALTPVSAPIPVIPAPAAANDEAATSQSSEGLYGKSLPAIKSENQPEIAPPASKKVHRRSRQRVNQKTQAAANAPAENPEIQQLKTINPQQRADNEFHRANLAVQEGRTSDALEGYRNVLIIDPTYKDARRAWVGLLLKLKRNAEAESVLKKGLRHDPRDTTFAMLLARLQVERDDVPLALKTLQKTLPYAGGQAEYQAFVAALLQRQNRHDEAIAHYRVALKLVPNSGIWWMGLGISLQALQRNDEARAAYQRAMASNSLNAELQAFVKNKLREL